MVVNKYGTLFILYMFKCLIEEKIDCLNNKVNNLKREKDMLQELVKDLLIEKSEMKSKTV